MKQLFENWHHFISEQEEEKTKLAKIAIFDSQNRALIVKRASGTSWMPGKWSLVGGHVEEGETAEEGMRRETKEETSLDLGSMDLISVDTIQMEGKDDLANIHFYATREFTGDVTLDYENDDFAWIAMEEIEQYDSVPDLKSSLKKALEWLDSHESPGQRAGMGWSN